MIRIVFETHSTTLDNERGSASGWLDSPLSEAGREQARALGARRREVDAVFTSDLGRALETATLAFEGTDVQRFTDWRLRECDYGALSGRPAAEVHGARLSHLDHPYPDGESYREVVARVASFVADLGPRWEGGRVLVIGHSATRFALDFLAGGADLSRVLAEPGGWRAGWEYDLATET